MHLEHKYFPNMFFGIFPTSMAFTLIYCRSRYTTTTTVAPQIYYHKDSSTTDIPSHSQKLLLCLLIFSQSKHVSNKITDINYSHILCHVPIWCRVICLSYYVALNQHESQLTLWRWNWTPGVMCRKQEFKWLNNFAFFFPLVFTNTHGTEFSCTL